MAISGFEANTSSRQLSPIVLQCDKLPQTCRVSMPLKVSIKEEKSRYRQVGLTSAEIGPMGFASMPMLHLVDDTRRSSSKTETGFAKITDPQMELSWTAEGSASSPGLFRVAQSFLVDNRRFALNMSRNKNLGLCLPFQRQMRL